MKLTRCVAIWLVFLVTLSPATGRAALAAGIMRDEVYALAGQVKSVRDYEGLSPTLTARLYFPKSANKPVLVAYVDGAGNFAFSDLHGGDYLLEIYVNNQMLYQKSIRLPQGANIDDSVVKLRVLNNSEIAKLDSKQVCPQTKLKQRNSTPLNCSPFDGKLTVAAGNINKLTRRVTIKVSETGTSKIVAKEDKKIGKNIHMEFRYDNVDYFLQGYTKTGLVDYLYFEVFQKKR